MEFNVVKFGVLFVIFCGEGADFETNVDTFPACSRSSPDLGDCLLKSLNTLRSRFKTGKLASNFIVDPLDPFYLHEFEVIKVGPFRWTIEDINMYGTTGFNLEKIVANLDGNNLQVLDYVSIPKIDMRTKYKFTGPIGISQSGTLNFSLFDFKVHGDTRVLLYKRDETEYAKVTSVKLTIDSTKLDDVSFSLPFIGDRELGFVLKQFVKLFGERMTKVAYRINESKVDRIHIDTVNRFLMDVPADVFLPA